MFFVPVNWLQTAIAAEHLNTRDGATVYRLSPSAEVRLTPNFRLVFSTRNTYAETRNSTHLLGATAGQGSVTNRLASRWTATIVVGGGGR